MDSAATVLLDLAQVLLVPFCAWVAYQLIQQGKTLVRIETALFGAQGDNGLNGDMREMKAWRHKEGNRRHSILARLFRLEEHAGLEPIPTQAGE